MPLSNLRCGRSGGMLSETQPRRAVAPVVVRRGFKSQPRSFACTFAASQYVLTWGFMSTRRTRQVSPRIPPRHSLPPSPSYTPPSICTTRLAAKLALCAHSVEYPQRKKRPRRPTLLSLLVISIQGVTIHPWACPLAGWPEPRPRGAARVVVPSKPPMPRASRVRRKGSLSVPQSMLARGAARALI